MTSDELLELETTAMQSIDGNLRGPALKAAARIRELEATVERLRVANIQMQFALGYPMPAEMEHYIIPSNPWKCGMCEARHIAAQPDAKPKQGE